jgi:serine/threonine protein kinase
MFLYSIHYYYFLYTVLPGWSTRTRTHTHAHAHTRTHAYTHAHTYNDIPTPIEFVLFRFANADATSGLDWHTRYKIIEGISYGLKYLHEQSDAPIIHLDLKPANILLDANMLPKIADFGISRVFDRGQTIYTKTTSGTL